jgi:hypothetical protein
MALTNGKNFTSGPLIFLSPRSQKTVDGKKVKVDPHFEISRIGEDKKIKPSSETCTTISGNLIKIELKDREFNNQINKHAILYIKDGDDTYHLDLTYRLSTRSLFNALINLPDAKNISIGIYESKKGFETFSLRQNDEVIKWKYTLEEQPAVEEMVNKAGTKKLTDYSEVDAFFEGHLRAWSDSVLGVGKTGGKTEAAAPAAKAEKPAVAAPVQQEKAPKDSIDEDVPF